MLVLSRKKGESIVIRFGNEEVVVTICEIRGDKVRIGTTAPDHIRVDREEVLTRGYEETPDE